MVMLAFKQNQKIDMLFVPAVTVKALERRQ